MPFPLSVITSYSIHYTKLYEGKFQIINGFGFSIVRGQGNVTLIRGGGIHLLVKDVGTTAVHAVFAHGIEQTDKIRIALTVNGFKLYCHQMGTA